MKPIWIASDNEPVVNSLTAGLPHSFLATAFDDLDDCLTRLKNTRIEFLLVDIELLVQDGTPLNGTLPLQPFWLVQPDLEVVVLTPPNRLREAVYLVKTGASNYLIYPVDPVELKYVIDSIDHDIKLQAELAYFRNQVWKKEFRSFIQTRSPLMEAVYKKMRAVMQTDSTVMLTGETGTGKGVMAKLIHQHSRRGDKQFISLHCGAIPDTLLESELFGHEKGAFTGAHRRKMGKFEIASGGTLFLDEIGTISPAMQIKLLQVLQEKTFHRLGGENSQSADVRIIAASNVDLKELCQEGQFRWDLFYRLNVFPIEVPPLRERSEDVPLLAEHFLKKLNRFYGKSISDVHPDVMRALRIYAWPGNIRELENIIERAYILEESRILSPTSLPFDLFVSQEEGTPLIDLNRTLGEVRQEAVDSVERLYLTQLLMENQGKIQQSAQAAGLGVRQLHKLLSKHHIKKEQYKKNGETGTGDSDL